MAMAELPVSSGDCHFTALPPATCIVQERGLALASTDRGTRLIKAAGIPGPGPPGEGGGCNLGGTPLPKRGVSLFGGSFKGLGTSPRPTALERPPARFVIAFVAVKVRSLGQGFSECKVSYCCAAVQSKT